ncbi:MAG: DUF4384 domain-containing protein [Rhizomicrobium sp.]
MFDRIIGGRAWKQFTALSLIGSLLAGCATHAPDAAYVVAQPQQTPVATVTNFTEALRCMDDMFLQRGFRYNIPITSVGILDRTGKVNAGTRDMLIAAVSAMSLRSGSFRYVDQDISFQEVFGPNQRILAGGLFIRGSISELDQGVTEDSSGGGITVSTSLGAGFNRQNMSSLMTVDMSLDDIASRTVLPGTSVSNTLAIGRRSKGADLDARISSVGLDYSVSMNEQEGTHAGLRTLIELTAIEMLGRYAKVPYWQCLGLASTDPRSKTVAYDQFTSMRDEQRVSFIASALKSAGYYGGPAVTVLTPELRAAAARYQQDNNMPALGLLNFELYYALVSGPAAASAPPLETPGPAPGAEIPQAMVPAVGLSRLSAVTGGVYVGETITFTADLAHDGYLACFYQDGDGRVFRTYPNPTQPSEFVGEGRKVQIPGAGDFFRIRPTTAGRREQFTCFSSSRSVLAALPENLSRPVLAPLPVDSLSALYRQLSAALGRDLQTANNIYPVAANP